MVSEWSEWAKTYWRASSDRAKEAAGRERPKYERLHNILEEEEGQTNGIIGNIEDLQVRLEALEVKLRHPDRWQKTRRGRPPLSMNQCRLEDELI